MEVRIAVINDVFSRVFRTGSPYFKLDWTVLWIPLPAGFESDFGQIVT